MGLSGSFTAETTPTQTNVTAVPNDGTNLISWTDLSGGSSTPTYDQLQRRCQCTATGWQTLDFIYNPQAGSSYSFVDGVNDQVLNGRAYEYRVFQTTPLSGSGYVTSGPVYVEADQRAFTTADPFNQKLPATNAATRYLPNDQSIVQAWIPSSTSAPRHWTLTCTPPTLTP